MAGLSDYAENEILDHIRGASWTAPTVIYIRLHVGDPTDAGTSNLATEPNLKQVTFAAASGGSMATSADLEWTSVAATEDYTHFSLWDGSTGPGTDNCLGTGTITANQVTSGDTFRITTGNLTFTLD